MPCLTRDTSKKFLDAIRDGTITPEKMIAMTSKERQAVLSNIVGPENVPWVNAALESKILLKDQQRGMVSWAKKTAGLTEPARRDLISRIQKETKIFDPETNRTFLESLAAKKLGHEITFEEAKNISRLATEEKASKSRIKESDPIRSPSRMDYGMRVVEFKDYVGGLKNQAGKVGPMWYVKHPLKSIYYSGGVAKSIMATLDNSFFLRQGMKVLWNHPDIWAKGFLKSWATISKELAGRDAMPAIRADIYSRPNALNGKYQAAKLDVGIETEEAFPSHLPSRIPVLGRLFKGAESAFNGGALKWRGDIADRLIATAERNGKDMLDPAQAEPIGKIVNAMTGRGNIGKLDAFGKEVNALMFSVKFLKSNFDTLTAHQFQKGITPYARWIAAKNLIRIVGGTASVMTLANMLRPGSAELDPRSSDFGDIKIDDTTFDISGGMGGMLTLAARLAPTMHNGKWGFWTKGRDGQVRELGTGDFGVRSPVDVLEDFFEGKTAPYASLVRDIAEGEDFQGNKSYVEGYRFVPTPRTLLRAHAPLSAQNFVETMQNPNAAPLLLTTIADGLGIGTKTYTPKPKAAKKPTMKAPSLKTKKLSR